MTNFVEGEGMTLKKNYPVGYNGITDGVIWQQLLLSSSFTTRRMP